MIPWLAPGQPFPPVERALQAPNGLLAASGELGTDRLVAAYSCGIYPWYSEGEPVLWWSPDPRMVLMTEEFHASRSLHKAMRRASRLPGIELRIDHAFDEVMEACAQPRRGEKGTWITAAVRDAYGELHRRGLAHSVETWRDGSLVGGLYLVALGRMIFGESMFAREADASKLALALLVRVSVRERVAMIDCQQSTRHLASLGARTISRSHFVEHARRTIAEPAVNWALYAQRPLNSILSSSMLSTSPPEAI